VNELLIYPEVINFNNYPGSVSARNIVVEFKLLENDNDVNAEGLPCIFGKSTSSAMTTKGITVVNYHNKKPKFYDEFKFKLPPKLTSAHHILASFYHIQCQVKKGKNELQV
jgi:hypothetical protein